MNTPAHKYCFSLPRRAFGIRGFSLIEMMISITIGLMIIAALVGVVASNSRSSKANDRTSELQSNGRYALDFLKFELLHAGFRGYTWAPPNTPTITGINHECLDGGAANSFVTNIRQGIWGANDSNPYSTSCMSSTNPTYTHPYLRGDVLVIRRLAGTATSTASLVSNSLYFRSSYSAGQVFQGINEPPAINIAPVADFALLEDVYYIGTDDNDPTVPALRRVSLQGNNMVDEMVVSGVEHMELQYGIAATDLTTKYYDANGVTGASTSDIPTSWENVNSVQIWLLVRNSKAEPAYTNTNTYTMGDVNYGPVNDNFRRQLFTTAVQLRN
jgi:type IV pilus assembly protein PilW